jgi:hypothetical protein
MGEKSQSRAQLRARIERLEEKLKRYEKPDQLRKEGEHWYELVEHFDARHIERLPVKDGRAFIMGRLDEAVVVEVSKETDQQKLVQIGQWLEKHGLDSIIVTDDIRFVKLRPCTEEIERKLDASQMKKVDDGNEESQQPARAGQ